MRALPPAPVFLASGLDPAAVVAAAVVGNGIERIPSARGPILILPSAPGALDAALTLARLIREKHPAAGVHVLPAPTGIAAARPFRRGDWVAVDVSARGGRYDRVVIPRDLAEAGSLCVVSPVPVPRDRSLLAIGALAQRAHPRHAVPARLDRGRLGVAADIALVFAPKLVLVAGEVAGRPVAVATSDLIAAELVGLALGREGDDGDEAGPWEDPLVQRATELNLGVRLPAQIDLRPVWVGPGWGLGEAALRALVDRIRLRLGIPSGEDHPVAPSLP